MVDPPTPEMAPYCWPAFEFSIKRWEVLRCVPFTGYCAVDAKKANVESKLTSEDCTNMAQVVKTEMETRLEKRAPWLSCSYVWHLAQGRAFPVR
jgi:hypothetical protein